MNIPEVQIIGIGASAGGLTALKLFFKHLASTVPTAYVVIMHLPANYNTRIHEVIAGFTSIPVVLLTADTIIKAHTVYVLPGYFKVTLKERQLLLTRRSDEPVNRIIDEFFFSLARELGKEATGIIFSGAGLDGAKGMQAIHEQGGRVLVQNPQSAEYASMPAAVIALDKPEVMNPEAMGRYLQKTDP